MASDYGRGNSVIYDASLATYWENQSYSNDPVLTGADADQINLSEVTIKWSRVEATGIREDIAETRIHLFVDSGIAVPTAPLNAAQAATVEGFLDTWWTTCKTKFTSHWVLTAYSWRDISASGPYSTHAPNVVLPSPTWRTTVKSVAGTVSGTLADQTAMSVTFTTPSRRHWGRSYMPAPAAAGLDSTSRFTSAYVDAIAGAWDTLFNSMGTNATVFVPVVWSARYRGALSLVGVKIDDVPDVIRRRRPKIKTYEKLYTNTA